MTETQAGKPLLRLNWAVFFVCLGCLVAEPALVFFSGLLLGYLYYKAKSLVTPIIMHGIGNLVLVAVMPYLLGY